ncbi:hypothetical protein D3C85_869760 [compost metagenome]
MNLENIGLGVLKVLEALGESNKSLIESEKTSKNYRDWWQRDSSELQQLKEKYSAEKDKK